MRRELDKIPDSLIVSLSPGVLQRNLQIFMRVTVCWEKGNNHTFQGLLDTESGLTVITGDFTKHFCPSGKVGAYEGLVINRIMNEI